MKTQKKITYSSLSLTTGSDRKDIRRWLADDNLTLDSPAKQCIACILAHKREPSSQHPTDPKTGLTWAQSLKMEQARAAKRENDAKEREMDNAWMKSEWVIRKFTLLCDRLELVPGRAKNMGLSHEHAEIVARGSTPYSWPGPAQAQAGHKAA